MSKRQRAIVSSGRRRKTNSPAAIERSEVALAPIREAIEAERSRLMNAETILHCTVLAMNERDCTEPDGPYFQNIVDAARDLVRQSIDGLDSVRLYRAVSRPRIAEGP